MIQSKEFRLLHKDVQSWVLGRGWSDLRPIQKDAIQPVYAHNKDVIISAPTASGKTEAAFLPACTYIRQSSETGYRIIYLSPLKALINDQQSRLESLCQSINIRLASRHEDIPEEEKQRQIRNPGGIMLITPESLESILMRYIREYPDIFRGLNYFIIDEFHSFMSSTRGVQLISLLGRIEELLGGANIPRIVLSATFSDHKKVAEFLRPKRGSEFDYALIKHGYKLSSGRIEVTGFSDESEFNKEESGETLLGAKEKIAEYLFSSFRDSSNLVFTNSRDMVEQTLYAMNNRYGKEIVQESFFPHYSNITPKDRKNLEQRMKSGQPTTAMCTSTLELGIDIGQVDSVLQISSPASVASMIQRLGRSGRRDTLPTLNLLTIEKSRYNAKHIMDFIRINTIQSLAMIDLMLEGWCEPPSVNRYNFSTLFQQILSIAKQNGGIVEYRKTYGLLCERGPFNLVSIDKFREILYELKDRDILKQDNNNIFGLTSKGMHLVDRIPAFTVSFPTEKEYELINKTKDIKIGNLPVIKILSEGQRIIFKGEGWVVAEINDTKRKIFVEESKSGVPYRFGGKGFVVNGKIREKMFSIYSQKEIFNQRDILDDVSKGFLEEGIEYFNLLGLRDNKIIQYGDNVYIFLWCDDKVLHTIAALLIARGEFGWIGCHHGFVEVCHSKVEEVKGVLGNIFEDKCPAEEEFCRMINTRYEEKFDAYLSDNLRGLDYVRRNFDIKQTWQVMQKVLD